MNPCETFGSSNNAHGVMKRREGIDTSRCPFRSTTIDMYLHPFIMHPSLDFSCKQPPAKPYLAIYNKRIAGEASDVEDLPSSIH